jgi:erythromycin esterase
LLWEASERVLPEIAIESLPPPYNPSRSRAQDESIVFCAEHTKEIQVVRKCLLAIAVAGFACRPHVPEHKGTTHLPTDLPESSIVRQAEGLITGPDARPVAGALISVIDQNSYRSVRFSISGRDGRFSVGLPSLPVVVTATANGYVAGMLVPTPSNRFSFTLTQPSEATRRFSGSVADTKGQPLARVRVRLMNWSWPLGVAFYTSSDETGRFQFAVDSAGSYDLMVDDPHYISNFTPLVHHNVNNALLTAYERKWLISRANSVDESVLRELCTPLTETGVRQFVGTLRPAHVVGLGESTHGTREFTELRTRVIAELIRDGWLTTIALEASWEEATRLDDYVRRGKGTGREAVKSLVYWPWRTEEFLAFVESVYKLNDELPANKRVEFLGIDYAPPEVTRDYMQRYFRDEGSAHSKLLTSFDPLRRIANWLELSKLSLGERDELLWSLKELKSLAESQSVISLPTIQGLRITQLIVESHGVDEDFRDRVMGEAVLALLFKSDKERRVAIWGHSLHLAEGPIEGAVPLGHHLKMRLADKYSAIGSMFYEGSFRTYSGLQEKMVNHVVALPPPFFFEGVMHRASPSRACALDVREATRRSRDWISIPKHIRIYGGLEISESYPWPPVVIPDLWSALIFVPSTTPTTSLD